MAEIIYRANIKAQGFPFLSELFGRSIIIKGPDQTAPIGKSEPGVTDSQNQGIPQVYYCHNVLPTDNGYTAVAYNRSTNAVGGLFVKIVQIFDDLGAQANLAITDDGTLWVMPIGTSVWKNITGAPPINTIAERRMTVGTVSGVSYIYFANIGCYTYDFATNVLTATPLIPGAAGFTQADVLGVAENKGYLLAYTKDGVFWSSLVDPTDFDPSLTTGAGGGAVEGVRGVIVHIESVYGGFIIFTNKNAVSAIASDNSRFPFNTIEIPNAGGLNDPDFVSYDSNSSSVYAYTTAGLQQIALKGSNTIFPEVTDFISGGRFEFYDEATNTLSIVKADSTVIKKRLVIIASRYLVFSYGLTSLTHALVYDTVYKQWGKLKINHVDCFEWVRSDVETPKKSVTFCAANGELYVLDANINNSAANGVIILGKYQYHRARLITLEGVQVENVNQDADFTLFDLPSLDGKNFLPAIVGYNSLSAGQYREYKFHNTALSHSIVLKGGWNATSMQLVFHVHGKI
jgi:hypothetical protein